MWIHGLTVFPFPFITLTILIFVNTQVTQLKRTFYPSAKTQKRTLLAGETYSNIAFTLVLMRLTFWLLQLQVPLWSKSMTVTSTLNISGIWYTVTLQAAFIHSSIHLLSFIWTRVTWVTVSKEMLRLPFPVTSAYSAGPQSVIRPGETYSSFSVSWVRCSLDTLADSS